MALFFSSVAGFTQHTESVKKLDATIQSYKIFSWISDIDEISKDKIFVGPNGVLIYNNESARSMIKEAISTNLQAKGYTMDENNPDMLVSFQVLEQQAEFYTGYEITFLGLDSLRTEENAEKVNLAPGTLMINVLDAESAQVVWQGYSSWALNEESVKNEQDVKSAVVEIM